MTSARVLERAIHVIGNCSRSLRPPCSERVRLVEEVVHGGDAVEAEISCAVAASWADSGSKWASCMNGLTPAASPP